MTHGIDIDGSVHFRLTSGLLAYLRTYHDEVVRNPDAVRLHRVTLFVRQHGSASEPWLRQSGRAKTKGASQRPLSEGTESARQREETGAGRGRPYLSIIEVSNVRVVVVRDPLLLRGHGGPARQAAWDQSAGSGIKVSRSRPILYKRSRSNRDRSQKGRSRDCTALAVPGVNRTLAVCWTRLRGGVRSDTCLTAQPIHFSMRNEAVL